MGRNALKTIVLALSLLLGACATPRPNTGESGDPLALQVERLARALRPVDDWTASVSLRQRITLRWQDESARLDAVLEKRAGRLRLLALGPMNTPGFVITLEEQGLGVVNLTGRPIPFAPEHIIADVQRVYYPWCTAPAPCPTCPHEIAGIRVSEQREADGSVLRRFSIAAWPERGEIVVSLSAQSAVADVPRRANVENGWLGYTIEVETLDAAPIRDTTDRDQ